MCRCGCLKRVRNAEIDHASIHVIKVPAYAELMVLRFRSIVHKRKCNLVGALPDK